MKITYLDILDALVTKLAAEFGVTIHSDEVLEGFKMPCFFIKFVPSTTIETLNVAETQLTIFLTYFTNNRNEVVYLEIAERMKNLIDTGFKVKDRFVHVEEINDDRIGEKGDILQFQIDLTYRNKTQRLVSEIENQSKAGTVESVSFDETFKDDGDNSPKRLYQPKATFKEE